MNPQALQNVIALAQAALRGEKIQGPSDQMGALWMQVFEAERFLKKMAEQQAAEAAAQAAADKAAAEKKAAEEATKPAADAPPAP